MLDRLARNPPLLAGAFLLAALIGGGIVLAAQRLTTGMGKRAEIERIVRLYILEHPEILPQAMERLQAKEAERAAQAQADAQKKVPAELGALTRPYAGAWAGNPKGDVTVVAFMDYACGYCRASLPGLAELLARDPNVRVVYREFPVLGPDSVVASRWALAAAEQGKFKPFHDALFAADGPSKANIEAAARAAGLDIAKAEAAIDSQPVGKEIDANHAFGQKLAMAGTPSWVIGKQLLYGMSDYDRLAAAVAEARRGH